MNKELDVTPSRMAQKANTMAELTRTLETNLEELRESMTSLNSSWEGPAQQEFAAQFESDYETMKQMCQMIREFQQTFEYAKDEYTKCKQFVADTVAAIRV